MTRFIALNNLGIGLSLPRIMNSILKIESETANHTSNQKDPLSWGKKKQEFENSFGVIVDKMGKVISELLNFEVKIKNQYLGKAFQPSNEIKPIINTINGSATTKALRQSNQRLNSSTSTKNFISQSRQIHQEQALRSLLQKNMTPTTITQIQACSWELEPEQNLNRLSNKMEVLKGKIEASKQRQQKIWELFDKKRPSRKMFEFESSEENQESKQYKKLSDMLCDLVSQKNKSYYESYDTVSSSFQ